MKKIFLFLFLFPFLFSSCKEENKYVIVKGSLLMETEQLVLFKKDSESGKSFYDTEYKVAGKILMENDSMIFICKEPFPIDDTIGWLGDSLYVSDYFNKLF
jgi:uncharacterized protein YcfL